MICLTEILEKSALEHDHLCPRQVLGARMGVYASKLLLLDLPQKDKRLLTFVETDGCFVDGVSAATGCTVGHRTLRIVDYGKTAATFVDTKGRDAVRIIPHPHARQMAYDFVPIPKSRWHTQLEAYQIIPDQDLMVVQHVTLTSSLRKILSRAGIRVTCEVCKEEIINEREVYAKGQVLCSSCAGEAYYSLDSSYLERNLLGAVYQASVP